MPPAEGGGMEISMLIKDDKSYIVISKLSSIFYTYTGINASLLDEYDIYISDNILEDYKLFEDISTTSIFDGAVFFPSSISKPNKMSVLLTDNIDSYLHAVPHELCHVYDYYLFCNKYCNSIYSNIRENKLFLSFSYWSEFHVKLIEITCMFLTLDQINENNNIQIFQNTLDSYYEKYTHKLLAKQNPKMIDFMYYIGELYTCNFYNIYIESPYVVSKDLIEKYPFLSNLYNVFSTNATFDLYVKNQQELTICLCDALSYLYN